MNQTFLNLHPAQETWAAPYHYQHHPWNKLGTANGLQLMWFPHLQPPPIYIGSTLIQRYYKCIVRTAAIQ